jgi:fructose transport system permease protein
LSGTTQTPPDTYDAAEEFLDRRTPAQRVQTTLHKYPWLSPAVVLVASVIVFGFLNSNFATPNNLSLITQQVAVVGALAIGQTLIILTAGIDLSCGAIMVFASMVMAKTAWPERRTACWSPRSGCRRSSSPWGHLTSSWP